MKRKGYAKRSGRKAASVYKKGDYVEFQLNGRTVTGCLKRKNARGWVVQPSDRRRKEETFSEQYLGRVIDEEKAINNKGAIRSIKNNSVVSSGDGMYSDSNNNNSPTATPTTEVEELSSPSNKRKSGRRGSYSEEGVAANNINSEYTTSTRGYKKRKSGNTAESLRYKSQHQQYQRAQQRKSVTFTNDTKVTKVGVSRIGTRSKTRNSSEELTMESLPLKRTKMKKNQYEKGATRKKEEFPGNKAKKDEHVTVVKMLTGTLYLFRGERPRAEFVRSK